MTPAGILALYLVFFGSEFIFETILTLLNIRSIRRHSSSVPAPFKTHIDDKTYETSVKYGLTRARYSIIVSVIAALLHHPVT